jgi:hypothetical protein
MEIVPRNSPLLMKFTVSEIQSFAWQNEMKLNPEKCKDMTIDFSTTRLNVKRLLLMVPMHIEVVTVFKLLQWSLLV